MQIGIGFENPSPTAPPCKVCDHDANRHARRATTAGGTIDIVLAAPKTGATGGIENFSSAEGW